MKIIRYFLGLSLMIFSVATYASNNPMVGTYSTGSSEPVTLKITYNKPHYIVSTRHSVNDEWRTFYTKRCHNRDLAYALPVMDRFQGVMGICGSEENEDFIFIYITEWNSRRSFYRPGYHLVDLLTARRTQTQMFKQ